MNNPQFTRLVGIMQRLRSRQGGCPWDLEQDHKTLKPYLLEETYEVLDAIDMDDPGELKEELGDLLLQVVFHAQIANDDGKFDVEDVAKEISDKMVRRHPHVFGETTVNGAGEVVANWEEIKKVEKAGKGKIDASILDSVSKSLPALFENLKISKKVAKLGFDWKKPAHVIDKIQEEIGEVKRAVKRNDRVNLEEELGDLLFAVANLCRVHKINPELALRGANKKFRARFARMEERVKSDKKSFKELDFKTWDRLWEDSKKRGKTARPRAAAKKRR